MNAKPSSTYVHSSSATDSKNATSAAVGDDSSKSYVLWSQKLVAE